MITANMPITSRNDARTWAAQLSDDACEIARLTHAIWENHEELNETAGDIEARHGLLSQM